jgi:hypothetical protein
MDPIGCFDRFWATALAVMVAAAMAAGAVMMSSNRVAAQDSDWSQYGNGSLYVIAPIGGDTFFTIVEPPHVQDGFFCAVVEQTGSEICVPLANIAGVKPS